MKAKWKLCWFVDHTDHTDPLFHEGGDSEQGTESRRERMEGTYFSRAVNVGRIWKQRRM